jgi:hypothetical protein
MVEQTSDLFQLQCSLEEALTAHINDFERKTGMSVHSIKVFRSEPSSSGKRIVVAVEIAAMLR